MPMEQPEMERRIVQNTHDILSIYDLLAGMEATLAKHSIRLTNLQHRLEDHDTRFDDISTRLDGMGTRLNGIGDNVAEILRRMSN